MTKRIVEMNLRILQAVMKQPSSISLHPVVLFGALLGIVRDNRLLEWNNDVELGVADINWNEESIQDLISGLRAEGYLVNYYRLCRAISIRGKDNVGEVHINYFQTNKENIQRPLEPSHRKYTNPVSFYLYLLALLLSSDLDPKNTNVLKAVFLRINRLLSYKVRQFVCSNLMACSTNLTSCKGIFIFPFKLNNTKQISFHGITINIPVDEVEVVRKIYGCDWKIPKKDWSYYNPKNYNETSITKINQKWQYDNLFKTPEM